MILEYDLKPCKIRPRDEKRKGEGRGNRFHFRSRRLDRLLNHRVRSSTLLFVTSHRTSDRMTMANPTFEHMQSPTTDHASADLTAANRQVADYLARIGWGEEAAIQRSGRLVEKARESLESSATCSQVSQRQLVRLALSYAIESATASSSAEVVPTVCRKPMSGGGQAERLRWIRLDWWLARLGWG